MATVVKVPRKVLGIRIGTRYKVELVDDFDRKAAQARGYQDVEKRAFGSEVDANDVCRSITGLGNRFREAQGKTVHTQS